MERSRLERLGRTPDACGVCLFGCCGVAMLVGFAAALFWILASEPASCRPEHVGGSHAWDEERR